MSITFSIEYILVHKVKLNVTTLFRSYKVHEENLIQLYNPSVK